MYITCMFMYLQMCRRWVGKIHSKLLTTVTPGGGRKEGLSLCTFFFFVFTIGMYLL